MIVNPRQDFQIRARDRIAQLVVVQCTTITCVVPYSELSRTERDVCGFGSTGINTASNSSGIYMQMGDRDSSDESTSSRSSSSNSFSPSSSSNSSEISSAKVDSFEIYGFGPNGFGTNGFGTSDFGATSFGAIGTIDLNTSKEEEIYTQIDDFIKPPQKPEPVLKKRLSKTIVMSPDEYVCANQQMPIKQKRLSRFGFS
ncbi:hypothetical protein DP148_27060, partial [Salmonella enterica subsp. enterica serovar Typhimurium]